MAESAHRSARLLFDLQACQTLGSAHRGVGRYSHALFTSVCGACAPMEPHALVARSLPHRPEGLPTRRDRLWELPSLPEWQTGRSFEGGERDALDALAYTSLVQRLRPDVVHVSHVFEGLGDRCPLPDFTHRAPGQVFSATLYDLIPLIFPEHYFGIPGLERWYHARLAWLRQADLLLAISEATRADAIRLLGIDPSRVVTIHGGIGAHFVPAAHRPDSLARLRARYPALKQRFVLYTGGDDHRKNLEGAIAGFAAIPAAERPGVQLVIVCSIAHERRQFLQQRAGRAGLRSEDLLVTGFVPDDDLVALYATCELFMFPSLYEGLGLPVLEAMACGAAVVGSDNSSIREIIERPDALFAGDCVHSIAARVGAVLKDAGLRQQLREYGPDRVRAFRWEDTAAKAVSGFDEALSRATSEGRRCTASGWLPRKRLAVLSPLPPAKSGIADYNAAFLPFLANHFDIDLYVEEPVTDRALSAAFRAFDVREFDAVAPLYDLILYEFGNSSFHAHMIELLKRHPGVVGLHDAYLSGLMHYLAYSSGDAAPYRRRMLQAHGPRARRLLGRPGTVQGDAAATVELPCTKEVIDHAIGIISHSPFNLAVARSSYPHGWLAPYRTIPQMVAPRAQRDSARRRELRAKHAIGPDDFVVVSFGHVAWTKWGDRLLDAFLASPLRGDKRAHLVFAGELTADEFGEKLRSSIARSKTAGRVRITGYLPQSEYDDYLGIADVAVQLRTRSRGGTPKGVLDCMASGLAVIVNNDASYMDYPDDVVVKLLPDADVASIAVSITRARDEPAWLAGVAQRALDYVRLHHAPATCAAQYAAAMHEFSARHRLASRAGWLDAFAPHLPGCADVDAATGHAEAWLDALPTPAFEPRRLFVDVSHIVRSDHETGIPRVVKMIVQAMYQSDRAGFEPVAVELRDGVLQEARDWLHQRGYLLDEEARESPPPVSFRPGDVLLMLDSSWARYPEFHPTFAVARSAGAEIVTAVYDLLPITLPPGNIIDGGKAWFESWFRDAAAQSDGLVCISRAVAHDVESYLAKHGLLRPELRIGCWHLGADFVKGGRSPSRPTGIRKSHASPYLLMLGTIEPRKSHALALAAMELLWARGEELHLVIAGKEGWMVTELMQTLRSHAEQNRRLWLLERPSDDEVSALYDHAAGLLFLSKGEGFGLPLVEAAERNLPILCSSIPAFLEIAEGHATFTRSEEATELAEDIGRWNEARVAGTVLLSGGMPRSTWEQSAEQLLDVVLEGKWLERSAAYNVIAVRDSEDEAAASQETAGGRTMSPWVLDQARDAH